MLTSISEVTNDFIILSVHDDVDVLVKKDFKESVIKVLEGYNFRGHINGNPNCLYYSDSLLYNILMIISVI